MNVVAYTAKFDNVLFYSEQLETEVKFYFDIEVVFGFNCNMGRTFSSYKWLQL